MDRKRLLRSPLVWVVLILVFYLSYSYMSDETRGYKEVDTSVAMTQLADGNVTQAQIDDKEQRLRLTLDKKVEGADKVYATYPARAADRIFNDVASANLAKGYNAVYTTESALLSLFIYLIPIGLILLFLFWMMNNAQGGGNKVLQFGKSKAKMLTKDMPMTKFSDVAGADEAVEELDEIRDFLANPARYQALGAKIPKGVLLYGPPGTGKTLLARAVAGEAGVPFYSISGSDFVEMFVGVGASRVRDLFEQAKANAPAIVFVDEIDAVGRHRGAGMGGGHDEREQTLNQLLVEMDGFESTANIILIAATNRPDILDPALLRPGRFDRQIPVGNPDLRGREAILQVHAKGKPFADDVDFTALAKRTVGMSGADLANVINEAALLTARENGTLITGAALEESVDRVVGGPARKGRLISEQEKKITAYHEAGHTLAAWAMPGLEPVYKVTIQPRGRTGGHALVVPEDDKSIMTRSEMIARLVMAMGGRAAEELVFAEPTTGASSDIAMATKIARSMVTEYGMSAKLGAVKYGSGDDEPFLGRTYGHQAEYSIEAAKEIDDAIRTLIEAAHNEAWAVLNSNRELLDTLAGALLEKETVERKELEVIFSDLEKRPRITAFDDFGARIPSDRPPIKTPGELAIERGEPWPPPPPPRKLVGAEKAAADAKAAELLVHQQHTESGHEAVAPVTAETQQHSSQPGSGAQPRVAEVNGSPTGAPPPEGQVLPANGYVTPPNWTGGVLPGPLAPLPGFGVDGMPVEQPPSEAPAHADAGAGGPADGTQAGDRAADGSAHGNGASSPHASPAAGQPAADPRPRDPWAPPEGR